MKPIYIFLFVIVSTIVNFVVLAMIMARRIKNAEAKKINPHWQWLVDKLGLGVQGGEPMYPDKKWLAWIRKPLTIEGTYRNFPLKIYNYTSGSGKNSTTYSTARITGPNTRNLSFEFHREGVFSKLGKTLGMSDIQSGDERFDRMFIIKANDPEFIQTALIPQIKELFYTVWEQHNARGFIRLTGDELHYDEVGVIYSSAARERFAAVADLLVYLRGIIEFYNSKA